MNMETMFTCLRENVQYREETKRLLRKLLVPSWTKLPEIEWEARLLLSQELAVTKAQVPSNS